MSKILTLHAEGKKCVNIDQSTYDLLKDFILVTIQKEGPISCKDLNLVGKEKLQPNFKGSVPCYLVTVKLDLEARGLIERVEQTKGSHLLRVSDR